MLPGDGATDQCARGLSSLAGTGRAVARWAAGAAGDPLPEAALSVGELCGGACGGDGHLPGRFFAVGRVAQLCLLCDHRLRHRQRPLLVDRVVCIRYGLRGAGGRADGTRGAEP